MAVQRLQKELKNLNKEPLPGLRAKPHPSNILEWHYCLEGKGGSAGELGGGGGFVRIVCSQHSKPKQKKKKMNNLCCVTTPVKQTWHSKCAFGHTYTYAL